MTFLIDLLSDRDLHTALVNKEFYDKTGIYSEGGKYLVNVGEKSPKQLDSMKKVRKYLKMCIMNVHNN